MHTNILNKVLAALTGLLLCTESAVAQVQGVLNTSDAMGKVIDPDSIGGQYVKHMVDDGRGELVNLVFE